MQPHSNNPFRLPPSQFVQPKHLSQEGPASSGAPPQQSQTPLTGAVHEGEFHVRSWPPVQFMAPTVAPHNNYVALNPQIDIATADPHKRFRPQEVYDALLPIPDLYLLWFDKNGQSSFSYSYWSLPQNKYDVTTKTIQGNEDANIAKIIADLNLQPFPMFAFQNLTGNESVERLSGFISQTDSPTEKQQFPRRFIIRHSSLADHLAVTYLNPEGEIQHSCFEITKNGFEVGDGPIASYTEFKRYMEKHFGTPYKPDMESPYQVADEHPPVSASSSSESSHGSASKSKSESDDNQEYLGACAGKKKPKSRRKWWHTNKKRETPANLSD